MGVPDGLSDGEGVVATFFFDQVPNHCRDKERDQLRAPVFQGQSQEQDGDQLRTPVFQGQSQEQDGDQLRTPVFRDQSFHDRCATKFPRYAGEMF
jgi:hypothetical protein